MMAKYYDKPYQQLASAILARALRDLFSGANWVWRLSAWVFLTGKYGQFYADCLGIKVSLADVLNYPDIGERVKSLSKPT
jgi:hypothetical protein